MGEYECSNCLECFHLDEPPWDGYHLCDACREEYGDLPELPLGRAG